MFRPVPDPGSRLAKGNLLLPEYTTTVVERGKVPADQPTALGTLKLLQPLHNPMGLHRASAMDLLRLAWT